MITGGRTPEDLETLLEDACVLRDGEALAGLFEDDGVLIAGGEPAARGHQEINRAAYTLREQPSGYVAQPRRILEWRDTALLLGDGVINVARRGHDRSWRFAIAWLQPSPEPVSVPQTGHAPRAGARTKERPMHTMIVTMSVDPARVSDVLRHFEDDVLPWAKAQQGFVSGQWLCAPGDARAMGVIVFESAAAAETAAQGPRSYGANERDETRAWNIEDVSIFEQVAHA